MHLTTGHLTTGHLTTGHLVTGADGEHGALYDLAERLDEISAGSVSSVDSADSTGSAGSAGSVVGERGAHDPSKPVLLFTHGNGLNSGIWAAVVAHLANDFDCWGLDFRGHGAARATNPAIDVERPVLATEIIATVEHLRSLATSASTSSDTNGGTSSSTSSGANTSTSASKARPIVGVGHSLGAACMLMAEIEKPGTFDSLWLYEPVLFSFDVERPAAPSPLIEAARRRRAHFPSTQAAFERFIAKPPFADCDPVAVRAYVEIGTQPASDQPASDQPASDQPASDQQASDQQHGVVLTCSGETEARGYVAIKPMDFGQLGQVRCPTLVARGGAPIENNEYPPQIALPIVEELPNARLETFDQLSHFGPMQDGAGIAASVRLHIAETNPPIAETNNPN